MYEYSPKFNNDPSRPHKPLRRKFITYL
jgi:hypothetical protein